MAFQEEFTVITKTATNLETTGVHAMSSDKRLLADVLGVGTVRNELPKVATELGMGAADLARVSYVSLKTVQRVWDNDIKGMNFETLLKLLVALG
jgi:DNA-binding Xre family transcriptional regulator